MTDYIHKMTMSELHVVYYKEILCLTCMQQRIYSIRSNSMVFFFRLDKLMYNFF